MMMMMMMMIMMMMMMMMMMMPNSLVEKLYMYILAYLAFRPKTGIRPGRRNGRRNLIRVFSNQRPEFEVINFCPCSTQLSMKFILIINVHNNFWHFLNIYEQDKYST